MSSSPSVISSCLPIISGTHFLLVPSRTYPWISSRTKVLSCILFRPYSRFHVFRYKLNFLEIHQRHIHQNLILISIVPHVCLSAPDLRDETSVKTTLFSAMNLTCLLSVLHFIAMSSRDLTRSTLNKDFLLFSQIQRNVKEYFVLHVLTFLFTVWDLIYIHDETMTFRQVLFNLTFSRRKNRWVQTAWKEKMWRSKLQSHQ